MKHLELAMKSITIIAIVCSHVMNFAVVSGCTMTQKPQTKQLTESSGEVKLIDIELGEPIGPSYECQMIDDEPISCKCIEREPSTQKGD